MASSEKASSRSDGEQKLAAPSISLPKGGGAIRGMGEKFAANPVTGTGSMSVPLAASPGRSGFGPQLSLSYDSGSGNGPFGFGWSLSLPAITRKTDKGLPLYNDADESDVFILSGAEDLVPFLNSERTRFVDTTTAPGFTIHRYQPRIEGLFARIERWTNVADPSDVHWRSITRDNILTLYGKDADARIADKDADARIADPEDPGRIFSWLICETRDDKGNAVIYKYKAEDGTEVDLGQAHERNRGDRDSPQRTANRYLKRILYGNRLPVLDNAGQRPRFLTEAQIQNAGWMFELVFDYGEHDADAPKPRDAGQWPYRADPFSSYRAGFEVRTTRLCQRVLMFHHFEDEAEVRNDCLVRSTDFTYSHEEDLANARNPVYTFLLAVTQTGYKRQNGGYLKRSPPPVELEYSQPIVQDTVEDVDAESLENLPVGLDGAAYQWTDLHGEGIPGILTEHAGAWFYKRNLSPINVKPGDGARRAEAKFAPLELVASKPNLPLAGGQTQFMDLAGDGQPDLVTLEGPMPGLYEHDGEEGWQPFRPFTSPLNRDARDPNLRFVDLDGDGHADVLITEDNAFVWHPSLAEEGYGPARRVQQALDEEKGPRLVFADGAQSVYLADLSGDGLTDLARIRNGEVCYWPNLGYGRFGAKVTMDRSPHFDHPDQFDHKRVRLADIDGTGTTDILYLHRDGVRLYFNQSGNSWSAPQVLRVFPRVDELAAITPADLLGNGTACLVWSSPLPGDFRRQMRYVDLMGGDKPHLLVKTVNNLGAETRVHYAPSTKFYLQDKRDGKPWITRLPFPVHVVERVETVDRISRNRFVARYAYHHGYFDGEEREFRGFGMVEQFDTEEFAALSTSDDFLAGDNIDAASHVPPVHTKTWFHTGVYLGREHVSDFFAGLLDAQDRGEYYREPGLTNAEAKEHLLDDTVLPDGLTAEEEREACRALKGSMLRQEVYALDGTDKQPHPYTVAEQNFTIRRLQPRAANRHAVFFTHAREAISHHYERNPADPRISHALTLEVDEFGSVLKSAAVGYGRRQPDMTLSAEDRAKQAQIFITYTETRVTNALDGADDYRTPLPCETRTYELTRYTPTGTAERFQSADFVQPAANGLEHRFDSEIPYEATPTTGKQRRLIEHVRTLYRPDDLGVAQNDPLALLPLATMEPLALPGESYKLAFTPGLLAQVFKRHGQPLLPDSANVLGGQGPDRGGYLQSQSLKADGRFLDTDPDNHWWIPAGRVFLSPNSNDTAAQELAHARQNLFLPHRYRDPFHTSQRNTETIVTFDDHKLLVVETRDALDNTVRAENDYRVLGPRLMTDPNGNRSVVAFDVLGMVVATAVKGKEGQSLGDLLEDFDLDPTLAALQSFVADPRGQAASLLGKATTRVVYDLERYQRCDQPPFGATLARETHFLPGGTQTRIQIGFSYSDGFGREIQKKIQAEAGDAPQRGPNVTLPSGDVRPGDLVRDGNGKPVQADTPLRWVGNGRTVFNNKGKPVKQYEPFFSATHLYEEEREMTDTGVTPILFYDPVERVVATLHPNHTWEKVVFDPWRQESWDVSDTVLVADPQTDLDVGDFFRRLLDDEYLPTWHALRTDPAHAAVFAAQYPDATARANETKAANKTQVHAATPAVAHFDTLGRPFLTVAHNRFERADAVVEEKYPTRVELDIEGNQRAVRDAVVQNGDLLGRIVMRYDYDMLGNRIHQASMEAGERWMLNDVAGTPLYAWDSRDHQLRNAYDPLRRPTDSFLREGAGAELLVGHTVYGETRPNPEAKNLRGKAVQLFDQAGVVTSDDYDFKGNPLSSQRQLAQEYKRTLNWPSVPLETDIYTGSTTYDALNRPTELTTPHAPDMQPSVIRPGYNEANLLERVEANLRGEHAEGQPVWTPFVTDIDYDAKGQRQRIDYGNGVTTTYEYDPLTFRLIHLKTTRATNNQQPSTNNQHLQALSYTYDPVGNITEIRDEAQQTTYFNNEVVTPNNDYTYDAIYRLIEAKGREHIGQLASPQVDHDDSPRMNQPHPSDGQAMRRYTERYDYDPVGNFLRMIHEAGATGSWTRHYSYDEASLIEPARKSNRLSSTSLPGDDPDHAPYSARYRYDDPAGKHGNMTSMPHLPKMEWDFADQLQATSKQVVNNGGTPETTYYVYDAAGGQRARKVTELATGQVKDERIYLGGFEVYRRQGANPLVRETLHIMDDQQRIALVETKTIDSQSPTSNPQSLIPNPQSLFRYQLGNHLGSASLELDADGQIISYEEYYPYGSTSYQAGRSAAEVSLKRYRYTGMERDEESGLYYHGARYYGAWMGRWVSSDPLGLSNDGTNSYSYVRNNPISYRDPAGHEGEKGAFQWAEDKDENDLRHTRLMGARKILIARGVGRGSINKFLEMMGDMEILQHYGFERREKYSFKNGAAYQQEAIDAIERYDYEWRKNAGKAFDSMKPITDADLKAREDAQKRKEFIDSVFEGYIYVKGSVIAGFSGWVASGFTDDQKKITAAAGAGAALSDVTGVTIRTIGQRGSYSPKPTGSSGIGASPNRGNKVSPFSGAAGRTPDCVRCVTSLIDAIESKGFVLPASRYPTWFMKGASEFPTAKSALEYISKQTGVSFGTRLQGSRLGSPGDYVVFNAFNNGKPGHILWARVRPNGTSSFYDPQIARKVAPSEVGSFEAYQIKPGP